MSHYSTAFSQTLSLIPRHVFQKLAQRHKTGRSSRKFGFKEQFTVMAFIQLAARRSLRDGLRCLKAASRRLYHLGLKNMTRSTVADANISRPVGLFRDLFAEMYNLCASRAPKHQFRFKSRLFSLDATTIRLCLSLFPRASFRMNRGGIKLHVLLDHDRHIPAFATITDARTHESRIARTLVLPRGSILVFDKGYVNHNWFQALGARHISLVPRLKRNVV